MEMSLPVSVESFTTAFLCAQERDQILDKCMARIEKLTGENQELIQTNIALRERLLAALEEQLRLTQLSRELAGRLTLQLAVAVP
jgi:hypothetical protein